MPPSDSPWWDFPRSRLGIDAFVATGVAHGLAVEACLAETGLDRGPYPTGENLVSAAQELAVARNLARHLGGPPGLGTEAGSRFTLGGISILGYAMLASSTVREALQIGITYAELSQLFHRPSWATTGRDGRITLDQSEVPEDLNDLLIERDLAAVASVVPLVVGDAAKGKMRLELPLDPHNLDSLVARFPSMTVVGGLQPAFVVAADVLDMPLPNADPATARICVQRCDQLLHNRRKRHHAASLVWAILMHDPTRMPSMTAVAGQLHMDVRTLHRRLRREGRTFRGITNEVRRTTAIDLLRDTELTVQEIARRLGYSEVSAFSRAFKTWTGSPPSGVRTAGGGPSDKPPNTPDDDR